MAERESDARAKGGVGPAAVDEGEKRTRESGCRARCQTRRCCARMWSTCRETRKGGRGEEERREKMRRKEEEKRGGEKKRRKGMKEIQNEEE